VFVLSKGHAVATLASIYAELGYIDRSVLHNSRSDASILNGLGPLLLGFPGDGPMGQGLGVARYAIAGRRAHGSTRTRWLATGRQSRLGIHDVCGTAPPRQFLRARRS
jgi:transketolase N-terminal domain/subunit